MTSLVVERLGWSLVPVKHPLVFILRKLQIGKGKDKIRRHSRRNKDREMAIVMTRMQKREQQI